MLHPNPGAGPANSSLNERKATEPAALQPVFDPEHKEQRVSFLPAAAPGPDRGDEMGLNQEYFLSTVYM